MTDTGTISSVILAGSLGAMKFFVGGAPLASGVTTESGNLLVNTVGAVLLAVVAYFLKEDRRDFKERMSAIETWRIRQERRTAELLAHNKLQTPILCKLAGLPLPDIERQIKQIEEPDSPSDV